MSVDPSELVEIAEALATLTDDDLEAAARAVEAERARRKPVPLALPTYPALACPKCGNVPEPSAPALPLRGIEYVRVLRATYYLYADIRDGEFCTSHKETEQMDVAPMLACCVCGAEYAIPPGVRIT